MSTVLLAAGAAIALVLYLLRRRSRLAAEDDE